MALRDDLRLFAATPPAPLAVPTPDLPQWDGQIFVRRVASGVIHRHLAALSDDDDPRASTVVLLACDSGGNRIFGDEDALWLSRAAALGPTVERLYVAGCWHNGLTEANREGWRKNSPRTAENGSPCSSAAPSPGVSSDSTGNAS